MNVVVAYFALTMLVVTLLVLLGQSALSFYRYTRPASPIADLIADMLNTGKGWSVDDGRYTHETGISILILNSDDDRLSVRVDHTQAQPHNGIELNAMSSLAIMNAIKRFDRGEQDVHLQSFAERAIQYAEQIRLEGRP